MKRTLLLLAAVAGLATAAPPLPRDSVYQLSVQVTDDHARRAAWGERRGQPQIVAMIYTSCAFACPLIVEGGKAVEQSLREDERARLGVTLVTLDPARDTPAALARMRRERGIDSARWALLRPEPRDVRSIAGLLGVKYRVRADGEVDHTTALVLLDADGRVVARTEDVGGKPDPAFVAAVRRTVASAR